MGQKKLQRFQEIKSFPNVFERPENMQGNWNNFFKNKNEIVVELACGKGEYTLGLADLYPEKNFIGIDIKGNRIWKGAKTALDKGLSNVAFLRAQIEMIENYFAKDEVSELWITFPDPQLRFSKIKKRLTHPIFLRKYQKILKQNAFIHLKTDSRDLYFFTKKIIEFYGLNLIEEDENIYARNILKEELKIKTHYEQLDIAQSNQEYYLKFCLTKEMPEEKDDILKQSFRNEAADEKMDDYYTESGFTVFTEKYLLDRGYCCGNGCRHCPYDYKAVSEPLRSKLLAQRASDNQNK